MGEAERTSDNDGYAGATRKGKAVKWGEIRSFCKSNPLQKAERAKATAPPDDGRCGEKEKGLVKHHHLENVHTTRPKKGGTTEKSGVSETPPAVYLVTLRTA